MTRRSSATTNGRGAPTDDWGTPTSATTSSLSSTSSMRVPLFAAPTQPNADSPRETSPRGRFRERHLDAHRVQAGHDGPLARRTREEAEVLLLGSEEQPLE